MKKMIAMALALVLVAGLSVAGTVAYLQDQDSDINVMTLGNVYIEQIEQERDADGDLVEFTQNKPVYPAVYAGTSIPWAAADNWVVANDQAWKVVEDNENVVDKFISVENTGDSDAYVRTVMLVEVGENGVNDPYMHIVCNTTNVTNEPTWTLTYDLTQTVEIDGNHYYIYVFTYQGVLGAGETTIPNLKQIYLDKKATNEVCEAYGDTFEILALSQAVQTAGFSDAVTALNTAFGEVTAENVLAWFVGQ